MFGFKRIRQMWLDGATKDVIEETFEGAKKIANRTLNRIEGLGDNMENYINELPNAFEEFVTEAKWAPSPVREPIRKTRAWFVRQRTEDKQKYVNDKIGKVDVDKFNKKNKTDFTEQGYKVFLKNEYETMNLALDWADMGAINFIGKEGINIAGKILRETDDDAVKFIAKNFKEILETPGTRRELVENTVEELRKLKDVATPGRIKSALRRIGISGKKPLDEFWSNAKTKLELSIPGEQTLQEFLGEVPEKVNLEELSPPKLNVDRVEAPDEIKDNMVNWVEDNAKKLTDEYPHITFDEIKARVEKEGFDLDESFETLNDVFGKNPKKLLTALHGVRSTAINLEQEMVELQRSIRKATDENEIRDLTLRLVKRQTERDAVMEAVLGSGRVSAQLLAFRRMTARALKGTATEKTLTLKKILGKRFEPGSDIYKKFTKALQGLDPDNPKAVIRFLRQTTVPGWTDYLSSVWYNSVLSGPRTHIKNLVGNTLFGAVEATISKPLSYALDIPISKLQGRESAIAQKEPLGYYAGMLRGMRRGVERASNVLKTGFDPDMIDNPSKWQNVVQTYPWDAKQIRILGKVREIPEPLQPLLRTFGKGVSIPTRLLVAADAFAKGIFDEAAKFEKAVGKVWDKEKTVKQVIDEAEQVTRNNPDIVKLGREYADWMTFNNAPSKLASLLMRMRDITLMKPLVPFIRVADSLIRKGVIDYTPVGVAKGLKKVVVKNPDAAIEMARGIVGTSIMLTGALMYREGNLILNDPKTSAERDAFYRMGKQPWSIKLGDIFVPIRGIEPFSLPFLIGAVISRRVEEGKMDEEEATEVTMKATTEIGALLMDSSYLYSLGNIFDALSAASSGDVEFGKEKLMRTYTGIAAGLMPYGNLLRSIATSIDPTIVQYDVGVAESFKARVPGIRKRVPKRIDVFGEESTYAGGKLGGTFPFAPSTMTDDPVELELQRLDYTIGFPSKKVGERKLDDVEHRVYTILSGKLIYKTLQEIVTSGAYQEMSQNEKRRAIELTVSITRESVRSVMFKHSRIYKELFDTYRDKGFSKDESRRKADRAFDVFLRKIKE